MIFPLGGRLWVSPEAVPVVPIFRVRGFDLDHFPIPSFGRSLTIVILLAMARYSRAVILTLFPFLTLSINYVLTNQVI